jgi:fructuronate reductase
VNDHVPRLSAATLESAAPQVLRPGYDRAAVRTGVVHFGPGAFHRAHQAAYLDDILRGDPRWGICAVALNSRTTAEALRPQDGLYSLVLLGEQPRYRVIGSVVELLTRDDAASIADRLASPETHLVTATVTEKGYHLTADGGLDFDDPAVARDLRREGPPVTLVGCLVHGLARRRAAGVSGPTLLSCDNLAANGRRLSRAVMDFAGASDPGLAAWIEAEVRFPCSMVDAITPATDDALRGRVRGETGLEDAWPVQREAFAQWVVEDSFAGERPPLERAGVQVVGSVAAFEEAKLRLLNGAHSTLAYLGLMLGRETTFDAMADPDLARFVERLMREDIAPALRSAPGLHLPAYIDAVLARFRNPAIRHLLSQIAWDGSQKLPFRLVASSLDALEDGRSVDRLLLPLAAWLRFVSLERPPAPPLVDPLAERLTELARTGPEALIRGSGVFPPSLLQQPGWVDRLKAAFDALDGPASLRARL